MKQFCEQGLNVLQNVDSGIIEVHRADHSLLDVNKEDAINTLVWCYDATEEQRTEPSTRLGDCAQRVFLSVLAVLRWRLGRSPLPGEKRG